MRKFTIIFTITIAFLPLKECISAVYINEIMASNVLAWPNQNEEYEDWIELYNSGEQALDISGLFLADNPNEKWQIPAGTIIGAKGYLIFIADGKTSLPLHTNFSLNKDGEKIYLFASDGYTVIDYLIFPEQLRDISYGRRQDGDMIWNYMHVISPGEINKPGYASFTKAPSIDVKSGFFSANVNVSIQPANQGDLIRFTLDGSDPKETSQEYTLPIDVNKSCILKARSFRYNVLPGEITSKSIFIGEHHNLPVISLITDPKNLYDPISGIYYHDYDGMAFERFAETEYFPGNKLAFHYPCGIRIQGNTGPMDFRKKSFRLFFRRGYGLDRLTYPIFQNDPSPNSKIVLRAGYDDSVEPRIDGTDNNGTLIRDPLITELWRRNAGLVPQSKFSALFLNGSFFGIYDIKQSVDEDFIKTRMGYSDLDIMRTRWDSTELVYGSRSKWYALINFFQENSFESEVMLDQASGWLDLDNYITLQAFVHAAQYTSWAYGVFMFRERKDNANWKFIIWDADRAFQDLNWNGFTASVNPVGNSLNNIITKKLLQNQDFKIKYINRICDLLNTSFLPANINSLIDSLAGEIRSEIPAEASKWNFSTNKWEQNLINLKNFAEQRPDIIRDQMLSYFTLPGISTLTLQTESSGRITINSITPDVFPWSGKYCNGIPVYIEAVPSPGYAFSGWSDETLPETESITFALSGDKTLKAIFRKLEDSNIELIAPANFPPNHNLPVIVRIRDAEWNINPIDQSPVILTSNGFFRDTTIHIKRGAGSGLLRTKANCDFILNCSKQNSSSLQKTIKLLSAPDEYYFGTLPSGEVSWDNSSIRHIINHLTIPYGTTVRIKKGTWVLLRKNINVYISGKLIVEGSKEEPVVITSENSDAWGGMEFTGGEAHFNYCIVTNGGGDPAKGNPTSDGWHTGRQHMFFGKNNAEFSFDNCFFLYSPGKVFGVQDGKVNVSNSFTSFVWHGGEFHRVLLNYKNSHLMNLPNDDHIYVEDIDTDGFHIDYVNSSYPEYSIIDNCYFVTGKDDAIDHHAARLKITNCWLEDFTHEGVAASGGDTVMIFNTVALKNDQAFEAGWTETGVSKGPVVIIDHCAAVNNNIGLRIGDSYNWNYRDYMKVTNTVLSNNNDNIWNYLNSTHAPLANAIDISFSITNDNDYNNSPNCITGIPEFDSLYFLTQNSLGIRAGTRGTNIGRADSSSVNKGLIVINEIMFNPSDDMNTGDWIELYNPLETDQNLSGWILKDDSNDHSYVIPERSIIPSKGYLILCCDTALFRKFHPNAPFFGSIKFGWGSADEVRIYNPSGLLMDSVSYSATSPWDAGTGSGYTLELVDAAISHTSHMNWKRSIHYGGSPGRANQVLNTNVLDKIITTAFHLYQNYPNPFNLSTIIMYDVPSAMNVNLTVYDMLGREVVVLIDKVHLPGSYKVNFNSNDLSSGIYLYRLLVGNFIAVKKMMFIK